MDKYYRLSCQGGDEDGWLVSGEKLEGDISATLQDWAGDDLGAWGYGDGGTRCANHAVGAHTEDGCEDCVDADYAAVWERIDRWAKQTAPRVAAGLLTTDRETIRRGDRSLWFRLREA